MRRQHQRLATTIDKLNSTQFNNYGHGGDHEMDITPHMDCKESDGSATPPDATSASTPCYDYGRPAQPPPDGDITVGTYYMKATPRRMAGAESLADGLDTNTTATPRRRAEAVSPAGHLHRH